MTIPYLKRIRNFLRIPNFRYFRIDWEEVGKYSAVVGLWLLEYSFKIVASVAGILVLAEPGSFIDKIKAGFASLTQGLRYAAEAPSKIYEMGATIHDYSSMSPTQFEIKYGATGIHDLMWNINLGIEYLIGIFQNISNNPISTLIAGSLVFGIFWLLARVLKFTRQKGQGSRLIRFERKLGKKLFNIELTPNQETPENRTPQRDRTPRAKKPQVVTTPRKTATKGSTTSVRTGNEKYSKMVRYDESIFPKRPVATPNFTGKKSVNGEKSSSPVSDQLKSTQSETQSTIDQEKSEQTSPQVEMEPQVSEKTQDMNDKSSDDKTLKSNESSPSEEQKNVKKPATKIKSLNSALNQARS